jgi:hypothetical protein
MGCEGESIPHSSMFACDLDTVRMGGDGGHRVEAFGIYSWLAGLS